MSRSATPESRCIGCESSDLRFFGARDGYEFHQCCDCGSLRLLPMPSEEEIRRAYRDRYGQAGHHQRCPDDRINAAQHQFSAMAKTLQRYGVTQEVLDCGCGWGKLMEVLGEAGIHCEGVDLSEEMVQDCHGRGLIVQQGSLGDIEGQSRYQAILMSFVFEHLTDHPPMLREACRLLKPGGLFISMQPTARGPALAATLIRLGCRRRQLPDLHNIFTAPWHTTLFSIPGMTQLSQRNGFEPVEVRIAPHQRERGLIRILQSGLEVANLIGGGLLGPRWPLAMGHVFVFRKAG